MIKIKKVMELGERSGFHKDNGEKMRKGVACPEKRLD